MGNQAMDRQPTRRKMEEVLTTIKGNIQTIKSEDSKPFPNFVNIKNKWNAITRQVQDLNTLTIRAESEQKI